ncbi:MAG: hypothetical protein IPM47_20410 [Sphingobacteriales bacterium]|nr:MAG: hypothetical protein IPM47_20410 [Sphingobacteriales bacterium]
MYGDIIYATIVDDPYISKKDCVALLQYQEFKSVHTLGHRNLCGKEKFKKGNTYPVMYLKGIPRYVEVSASRYWFALPFALFCMYFVFFTIKEHIKFFREEKEKKLEGT